MKQLLLFEPLATEQKVSPVKAAHWKLFVDGASRNNPGPAGAGIYLLKDGIVVEKHGFFLGTKTNNQAEYLALLIGLFFVKQHMDPQDFLEVISDSQLLIRQLQGAYKVSHPELKPLFNAAKKILSDFSHITLHVLRHENVHADRLANEGVDKKIKVSDECRAFLASHAVSF